MRSLAAMALVLVANQGLAAQITIPGSEKETVPILSGGTSLNLDVSQAKLGLNLNREIACSGKKGKAREACLADVDRHHWDIAGRVAAAAQDGKRTLFSSGEITPGLELGGAVTRTWESSPSGYRALFVSVVGKVSEVKFAAFDNDTASLQSTAQKSLTLGAGYIDAITEGILLAFSVSVQPAWDSPGLSRPVQVCTAKNAGMDTSGATVTANKCEDRVIGPLVKETVWQPRVEFLRHFPQGQNASFGVVGSFAPSLRSGKQMALNASLGPTIHPAGRPREVLAAVLFTLTDFTDANDRDLELSDIFSIRLFLAVPLTGF